MTREEATTWFWKVCPPNSELLMAVSVGGGVLVGRGWVYLGKVHNCEVTPLADFLSRCRVLTGDCFAGSLDNDSDLIEYVRGAFLAAYGRADACRVRIVR